MTLRQTLTSFLSYSPRRYFVDDKALGEHKRSKVHKRRLKELEYEPYSQEESERASGMGSYLNSNKRRKVNDEEKG